MAAPRYAGTSARTAWTSMRSLRDRLLEGVGRRLWGRLVRARAEHVFCVDPLAQEPGVSLTMVRAGQPIPDCDLVILPGSKSTRGDLAFLRAQGWDIDLIAHHRRGGTAGLGEQRRRERRRRKEHRGERRTEGHERLLEKVERRNSH